MKLGYKHKSKEIKRINTNTKYSKYSKDSKDSKNKNYQTNKENKQNKQSEYDKKYHEYKKNRKIIDILTLDNKHNKNDESTKNSKINNIAIIIPYRNRHEHLKLFIEHFNKLNSYSNIVDVYVIDQNNADGFNRGLLLNIGFEIAKNIKEYDRFIFHDVDSYPDQTIYDLYFEHFDKIIHFASPYLGYKYTFYTFFGGIVGMNKEDYEKINGFPNSFFFHGGEDDAMFNRIALCDIKHVYRPNDGKYYLVDHEPPTMLEQNKIKKKNILDDLVRWKHDGIKQLKNIFLNIKKYESYEDFMSKYEIENTNIINDPMSFNDFINMLLDNKNKKISNLEKHMNPTNSIDSIDSSEISLSSSPISDFEIKKNNVNYYFYKIDYLAKHKFDHDMFMDTNFVKNEIENKNKKLIEGDFKGKKIFYNKNDKSFVSVIYPIISWNEVEEKIINTYTTPKEYINNKNTKYNDKLKHLLKNQFEKYNKNLSKNDLFNTLKHIFDNYNEVLYFRIRDGKIECEYQLYNPKNKKDWYKDLKYSVNEKTNIGVDEAFLHIAKTSNKEYFTLRKPHFMASNNCLLGGLDEYAYWEGNPVSYVGTFKEMIDYVVNNYDVPDCDILINRKDFPYLRKDKKYGYDHLTDDKINNEDFDINFYPLASQAITDDSLDIPIISADEWEFSKTQKNKTNWSSKNPVALFRGSGTGCSVDMKNPRIKLAQLSEDWSKDPKKANLIDVKLSKLVGRIKAYNKLIGITDYKKHKHLVGEFMTTEQQMKYKYVFNIEGNSQAYRFSSQFYKGLVINVKSKYHMWFEKLLKLNVHYVEVENDYSDLYEKLIYLKNNDKNAEEIYKNGIEFADIYTSKETLAEYIFHYMYYLNKYSLK